MTVRCTRCGEELMGAVNRCWKCGQQFQARPTVEGLPPVRAELVAAAAAVESLSAGEALEAKVLDEAAPAGQTAVQVMPSPVPVVMLVAPSPPLPAHPLATPRPAQPRFVAQPTNVAAVGGAYAALALGLFAVVLSWWRYEGAIVALVGLMAGIWGIYSPRRNWALVGMLLCALGIGLGTFTGVRQVFLYLNRNAPIEQPATEEPEIQP